MPVPGTPRRMVLKAWKGVTASIFLGSRKFAGLGLRGAAEGPSPLPRVPWHFEQVFWKICLPEMRLGHWAGAMGNRVTWMTRAWILRASPATFSGSALDWIRRFNSPTAAWISEEALTSGRIWLNSTTVLENSNCSLYSEALRTLPFLTAPP